MHFTNHGLPDRDRSGLNGMIRGNEPATNRFSCIDVNNLVRISAFDAALLQLLSINPRKCNFNSEGLDQRLTGMKQATEMVDTRAQPWWHLSPAKTKPDEDRGAANYGILRVGCRNL